MRLRLAAGSKFQFWFHPSWFACWFIWTSVDRRVHFGSCGNILITSIWSIARYVCRKSNVLDVTNNERNSSRLTWNMMKRKHSPPLSSVWILITKLCLFMQNKSILIYNLQSTGFQCTYIYLSSTWLSIFSIIFVYLLFC